jgi:hypothetical protein
MRYEPWTEVIMKNTSEQSLDKRITWRMHIEMTEAKAFRTFIRIYSLCKSTN